MHQLFRSGPPPLGGGYPPLDRVLGIQKGGPEGSGGGPEGSGGGPEGSGGPNIGFQEVRRPQKRSGGPNRVVFEGPEALKE